MNTKVDVSIILTTYNSRETLDRILESIINQKTKYIFEIIAIDDGSTDGTVDILKQYEAVNDNMHCFFEENSGLSKARNNGISHANGDYIMFSDDDDEYMPEFINDVMEKSIGNKLVIAGIKKELQSGKIYLETDSILNRSHSNDKLIENYLVKNQELDVGAWNKLYSKDILKKNNLKFVNKAFFEDSLFILKYLLCINYDDIGYVEKPEYFIHKRTGSITNSYEPELQQKCDKYIKDVSNILMIKDEKLPRYFNSFKARIYLYYVHRNILTNVLWTSSKQRNYLKKGLSFDSFRYLNNKYRIALLVAFLLPSLYIKLYLKEEK